MKRKLKIWMSVVVMLALCIWVASRWKTWFKMPDEPAYVPSMVPDRILLTFGDSNERNRNVSWMCDTVLHKDAYLELAEEDSMNEALRINAEGEVFESRSGKACYYHAKLRDLKPDKRYFYRTSTNGAFSKWLNFRTYPSNRDGFSFIYVGDVQDSIGGKANDYLRMAFCSHPEAEMLLCGGDLIERPSDHYYAETFRDLDSICTTVPIMTVTGNHDYLKGVIKKLEHRFSLTFSYFLDSMVGENQVYHLNYANAEFFLLDSDREPNYLWTQRQWLKEHLENSKAKWKILVLHHPLYSIGGKYNNLVQRWMFDGLVREFGVDLVLQGHEHEYARMTSVGDSKMKDRTTPVYIVSHCSPKNYKIVFDERFDKYGLSSRLKISIRISSSLSKIRAKRSFLLDLPLNSRKTCFSVFKTFC
jgi:predicted phosphodiesterase